VSRPQPTLMTKGTSGPKFRFHQDSVGSALPHGVSRVQGYWRHGVGDRPLGHKSALRRGLAHGGGGENYIKLGLPVLQDRLQRCNAQEMRPIRGKTSVGLLCNLHRPLLFLLDRDLARGPWWHTRAPLGKACGDETLPRGDAPMWRTGRWGHAGV